MGRTGAMLDAVTDAVPQLVVDAARCQAALAGGALATDEVMRRVESGRPFRSAYREVATELKKGARFDPPDPQAIIARRGSIGGLGNLGLPEVKARIRRARTWERQERKRFERALTKLAGQPYRRSVASSAQPA
jgi:argininosuccinate lyase